MNNIEKLLLLKKTNEGKSMKKNYFQRMKMPLSELEEYYRTRREKIYEDNIPIKGIKWKRLIHPVLLFGLKINRIVTKEKLHIIKDTHVDKGKPLIYACTHIGWNDIIMTFAAIKSHAYLFWGDPRELYRRVEGFLLDINGCICCDTAYKNDRHIGKETCIRLLQQGGSLLIYPEGAWNVIENQVVMPLYSGAVEMAIRTKVEIVPIAIEKYGKSYYVNIGSNVDMTEYALSKKRQAAEILRDILCTLKWEIWENEGKFSRCDIPDGYIKTFLAGYEEQMGNVYTMEDVDNTRYHSSVDTPEEAFAFMEQLVPKRENAFLFRKF